jgi:hypothetical protein
MYIEQEFLFGKEEFIDELNATILQCAKELNPEKSTDEIHFYATPLLTEMTKIFNFSHTFYNKICLFKKQIPLDENEAFYYVLSCVDSKNSIDILSENHIENINNMIFNIKRNDIIHHYHKIYDENTASFIANYYHKKYIMDINFESGLIPKITFNINE